MDKQTRQELEQRISAVAEIVEKRQRSLEELDLSSWVARTTQLLGDLNIAIAAVSTITEQASRSGGEEASIEAARDAARKARSSIQTIERTLNLQQILDSDQTLQQAVSDAVEAIRQIKDSLVETPSPQPNKGIEANPS